MDSTQYDDRMITLVSPSSLADQVGIKEGMYLVSINDNEDYDIIDYLLSTSMDNVSLKVMDEAGEVQIFEIRNTYEEPIGISLSSATFDKVHRCHNKCIFCFMDQLPEGLRETLYFHDDDYRLSFLDGNYVTLTNVDQKDLERICELKLSPLFISVHATDPKVRTQMLRNAGAGDIMQRLRTLADADIEFNIQIVLCPGINDGEVLSHTLSDLKEFLDNIISISVVPVGLTKYHKEGLKPYDRDQATRVLKLIDRVRSDHEASAGRCFVCASDEFYLLSDRAIPEGDYYEGFNQYEDGVGMARTFLDNLQSQNFNDFVNKLNLTDVAIATGELGYKVLSPIMSDYLSVVAVQNEFFGPNITATGLVVGSDLIHTLKDIPQSVVIIPDNMLNDEGYFLDGQRVEDVEKVLGKKVIVALLDGSNIIDILEEVGK